jgi:hypothetical protein
VSVIQSHGWSPPVSSVVEQFARRLSARLEPSGLLGSIGEPELAGLCRIEKPTSPFEIRAGHEDLNRTQTVEREAMCLSQ